MDEFAREFFGDQEGTLWAPGFTLKKLLEMVRDRIGALKNALYAECRGIACSSEECHGGYRRCTGCEVRAKAAFGPGWQEFVVNRSEGCQKCGAPVGSLHSLYCKA
jgi:hypothetical protein